MVDNILDKVRVFNKRLIKIYKNPQFFSPVCKKFSLKNSLMNFKKNPLHFCTCIYLNWKNLKSLGEKAIVGVKTLLEKFTRISGNLKLSYGSWRKETNPQHIKYKEQLFPTKAYKLYSKSTSLLTYNVFTTASYVEINSIQMYSLKKAYSYGNMI